MWSRLRIQQERRVEVRWCGVKVARPAAEARWIAKHKRWRSSARLSRYACILGVVTQQPLLEAIAVPSSTGHELGPLTARWDGSMAVSRSTSAQ